MKSILAFFLILCMIVPFLAHAESNKPVTVVASFYPIYLFTANLLKNIENVRLVSLTSPSTGCLHDYQLLTGDMRTLAQADTFCICGAGMEPYLKTLTEQFPALPVVDSSEGIDLIYDEDHGEYNAHIWLDAQNAIHMVQNLCDGLCQTFPDLAAQITANKTEYTLMLAGLDTEIKAGLERIEKRDIVTFHEAFSYFARAYGLHVAAVIALEPEDALSPQMLTEIIEKVRAAGNPPLFTEPQYTSAAARIISTTTGALVFELDPIVTGNGAQTAYEDAMRTNLRVLQEALGR